MSYSSAQEEVIANKTQPWKPWRITAICKILLGCGVRRCNAAFFLWSAAARRRFLSFFLSFFLFFLFSSFLSFLSCCGERVCNERKDQSGVKPPHSIRETIRSIPATSANAFGEVLREIGTGQKQQRETGICHVVVLFLPAAVGLLLTHQELRAPVIPVLAADLVLVVNDRDAFQAPDRKDIAVRVDPNRFAIALAAVDDCAQMGKRLVALFVRLGVGRRILGGLILKFLVLAQGFFCSQCDQTRTGVGIGKLVGSSVAPAAVRI